MTEREVIQQVVRGVGRKYAIERFDAQMEPEAVLIECFPTLEMAKEQARIEHRQAGAVVTVLWDSPLSGAERLLTIDSRPR